MKDINKKKTEEKSRKKTYERPVVEKHKSVAVVAGSRGCNRYATEETGSAYYF